MRKVFSAHQGSAVFGVEELSLPYCNDLPYIDPRPDLIATPKPTFWQPVVCRRQFQLSTPMAKGAHSSPAAREAEKGTLELQRAQDGVHGM